MALKDKFTPNSVIDQFEMDDKMIDVIGYVDQIEAKHLALNNAYVSKMVLNNGNGKRIQIDAWGKFAEKLESVAELQNVIFIEGAQSKYVSSTARYNTGNVNFKLEIKGHTVLKNLGQYVQPTITEHNVKAVEFQDLQSAQGYIRIKGTVKNNFRLLQTKFQKYGLGSITDGKVKLEVRILGFNDVELAHVHKGHEIFIEGEVIRKYQQFYLSVKDTNSIKIIEEEKRSLEFVLEGYRYVDNVM